MMHMQHTTMLANKRITVSATCCSSNSEHNETMHAFHPQIAEHDAQIDSRSVHYYPPKPSFDWPFTETFDSQFQCNHESASAVSKSYASCKIAQRDVQFPSQVCAANRSFPSETDIEWDQERRLQESEPSATDLEIETQFSLDIDSSLKRKREDCLLDFMLADFDPQVLRRKAYTITTNSTGEEDLCVNEESFIDHKTSRDESLNSTSAASRNPQNLTFEPTLPPFINIAISSLLEDSEKTRMRNTSPEASLFHLIDRILVSQVDTETTKRSTSCDGGVQLSECKSAKKAAIAMTDTQPIDVEGLLEPITFGTLCGSDRYWTESLCTDFITDADSDNCEEWHDIFEVQNEQPPNDDQVTADVRLKRAMKLSSITTSSLQEWDRANGLPKSHSQTMVNSSRSREQLQSGMVLQKWNGTPLLLLPGARVKIRRRMFKGEKVAGLSSAERHEIVGID